MLHLLPLATAVLTLTADALRRPEDEPLLDWSPWEKYRSTVVHPAATLKPADLERARANLERYGWARAYRDSLEGSVRDWAAKLTPEFLARMIPATTPGDTLFTPCPACRDQGRPVHPHGQWNWFAVVSPQIQKFRAKLQFWCGPSPIGIPPSAMSSRKSRG